MCPFCVSTMAFSTAAMAAVGVASGGGVAAVVFTKFRSLQNVNKTNNAIIPNNQTEGEEHETEYRIAQ